MAMDKKLYDNHGGCLGRTDDGDGDAFCGFKDFFG